MFDRRALIAGNWKMFKTISEALDSVEKLSSLVSGVNDVDIMIAPTFTALYPVSKKLPDNIGLGAQNVFYEEEGAFTGEISAKMVVSAGCRYVIIGHSERRSFFGETDESVNKKIKAAVSENLIPVFCIGETEQERDSEETFSILDKQVTKGLESFSENDLLNLVIAYEPVWAIGTGKTATPDQVQEVHAFLRSLIEKKYGNNLAKKVRIIYGGSVKPDNISGLMALSDVDGALVGGASLNPESFSKLTKFKK